MNDKKIIQVKFFQTDEFVYGYVKSMNESLKGKGLLIKDDENNIRIYSKEYTELVGNNLYLEGSSSNKKWFSYVYSSSKEAANMIVAFEQLINQINTDYYLTKKEIDYLFSIIEPFKIETVTIEKIGDNIIIESEKEEKLVTIKIGEDVNFSFEGLKTGKVYKKNKGENAIVVDEEEEE